MRESIRRHVSTLPMCSILAVVHSANAFNATNFTLLKNNRNLLQNYHLNVTTNATAWYQLKTYVNEDSILYDSIQGFFFATILCLVVICCYYSCYCCLIRCQICPDDRIRRRRRKKGPIRIRRPNPGYDDGQGLFAPLATNVDGDDSDEEEESDEDAADENNSSSSEDSVSLEYGGDQSLEDEYGESVDRFDEAQIENAAKKYFDNEEKARITREKKTQKKKNRSKKSRDNDKHDDYFKSAIEDDDEEEDAPLDLEMIERKLVENMEKSVFY
uniref:Uncharacterized protein n=1 Tax=Ditylum brightwellii TaxID=49249 RepID=A0A7S1VZM3_9STRA|mmetsp:Transcript_1147/g.1876  ORF Transcript_1147/g.1876 Transcript_1147/m.1876 type:complete len:272 (+) Transcript_1147:155-970(+)